MEVQAAEGAWPCPRVGVGAEASRPGGSRSPLSWRKSSCATGDGLFIRGRLTSCLQVIQGDLVGNGTPGVIRTPDPLLRRQTIACYLVDSLSFFFGHGTRFYGVFGRYCSLVVPQSEEQGSHRCAQKECPIFLNSPLAANPERCLNILPMN
jgi:hypothetical protein